MSKEKPKKSLFDNLKQTFNNFVDAENIEKGLEQSGFFRSVRLGRLDEVKKYIAEGQDINAYGVNRQTALHAAVSKNNKTMVSLLLKHKADPYIPADDTYGTTALDKIIGRDQRDILSLVRRHGVDLNKLDQKGESALYKAIDQNKPEIVKDLLSWGCDPLLHAVGEMSPVELAIKRGYTEVVDALLENPTVLKYLNAPDKFGMGTRPILHQMLDFGSEEIAFALVNAGAEMNIYDEQGRTPLQNAISKGAVKYVSLLAEKGADLNSMPSQAEGYLPLHFACDPWHWKNVETAEVLNVLLFAGADPNILSKKESATPLSILLKKDNVADLEKAVDVLLSYKAVTNVYDKDGKTPLLYAMDLSREKMQAVVEKMLEAGANPNLPEKKTGKTPLHYAVMRGDKWLIEKYMQHGGRANQKDKSKQTPLELAQSQVPTPVYLSVLQKNNQAVAARQNIRRNNHPRR